MKALVDLKNRNILNYYKKLKEHSVDAVKKIEYLLDVAPENGLAIFSYQIGTPLELIKKVNSALKNRISLDGFNYYQIETSHHSVFHIARNGSMDHSNFEKRQKISGGVFSFEISDLGEFFIVQVQKGIIVDGGDFSLYKTSDEFTL